MARRARPTLEEKLAVLHRLDVGDAAATSVLRDALGSNVGILVARAARWVGEARLEALAGELAPAFARLIADGVKRDPGCRGMIAVVKALHALDRWEDDVFTAGLRHVQHEGALDEQGRRDDTAAALRGLCGIVHAQFGRSDALDVLAVLLADEEHATRTAAARALGDAGRVDASALLRYKLLTGDENAEVLSACVESLLALAPRASFEFLVGLLRAHDERGEVVALGLGSARKLEALTPLTDWCLGATAEQRHRIGYLAIALLRTDGGNAYLLDLVTASAPAGALAAARALATFRDDAALRGRIRAAAAARRTHDAAFTRALDELLGD